MRQDVSGKAERPHMPEYISIRILEGDHDWLPRERAARHRFMQRMIQTATQPTLPELDVPFFIPIDVSRATYLLAYDSRSKGPPEQSGKRIIGMAVVAPRTRQNNEAFPDTDLVLSSFAVIPDDEYRQQGIGSYLLHHAIEMARKKAREEGGTFRRLTLETDPTTSEEARRLYRSFGFKEEPLQQQAAHGIEVRRSMFTLNL